MPAPKHFQPLFDENRNLVGVLLSPELWMKGENRLSPVIDDLLAQLDPASAPLPAPEPMKDWELLAQYWDFQYPMPTDVACENCGSSTGDWKADEPRKFRLKSATLGGLVNFECQDCRARILKRHFKKHVDVECRPFVAK
ncbi:hypothetical protein NNJEOMEG_03224 [Fundidesulfovibrio magnetotacticus]|uniref:Uncharacterized protein n=1 Tax=Fundidesulfovibrio magnetotacticus TaxID=2730080 RepID=A0A6V8LSB3_9BACT|nr:hypothetical protein [Fundidesulfovibrio magnetotacticus]GFK95362.1 hypothetical protein NNJEOMEG_03224 [Fundidesulfovibrio magnetotacticus]